MRVIKAIITNLIAWVSPSFYVRWTGETGRGREKESIESVAQYFCNCFYEYFEKLGVDKEEISHYLESKKLLEYGPGDIPGVALMMYAYGAEKVICIDRFPLVTLSEKNIKIMTTGIEGLPDKFKNRANNAFNEPGVISSGFKSKYLEYVVEKKNGTADIEEQFELIYSRAVLEHVNDLDLTFKNMNQLLAMDGSIIHQVDFKSHGLHSSNPLDFLVLNKTLWWLMYSNKGVPNRWRINYYRELLSKCKFTIRLIEATGTYENKIVKDIRGKLTSPFRVLSDEDLSWQGAWIIATKDI